ncbi:MAG: GNAT family N-acetyltransferase [Candidatus Acidiferrales bacterium]
MSFESKSATQFMDFSLARRLELVSAESGRACGESTAALHPAAAVAIEEIAGGIAVFAGKDSPVTQAIGVGMGGPVEESELDRLEDFYRSRGAATAIELCPLVEPALYESLARRAFRLVEVSNILVCEIAALDRAFLAARPAGIAVRIAARGEASLWTETVAQGFAGEVAITPAMLEVMDGFFHAPGSTPFLAFADGAVAGGGSAYLRDGVAGFFGASTLPAFRRRGVQTALLAARLGWAIEQGCDLAKGITLPGSSSQRNHERFGFRVAYTRTKLLRE